MPDAAGGQSSSPLRADLLVAGAGLSGLAAAATAVEQGRSVIVLEKMHFIGGAGLFPEGSLGIGTRFQRENGITTTVEQVFARVMEFHHWRCNAAVIRTLLEQSGATIDWIESLGVDISGIRTMFPPEKSLQTWHIFKGSGARVVRVLGERIRAGGGTILTSTRLTGLITGDGRVCGVTATDEHGQTLTMEASSVVMATGGFASNPDMLRAYVPDVSAPGMERLLYRGPDPDGRTGDGITLAAESGAHLTGMHALAGNSPYLDDEPAIRQFRGPDSLRQTRCALSQPFLWVDRTGHRFYNESLGSVFSDVYNAMTSVGGLMWSIFDENMKQRMISHGPLTPFNAIVVPGQPMTALDEGLQTGLERGYAFTAETIEDLAAQIGIPGHVLRATMQQITDSAAAGHDPQFGRKPEHLLPFSMHNGPYYALRGVRAFFLTLGGVAVNASMQALDAAGRPIPGLYVTGQDMGGLYDSTYDLLAEGSASSFALSSGRIAARAALTQP